MDGGVGHMAWAPEGRKGREGRSQAGPKGRNLEVGPRRGPRLLNTGQISILTVLILAKILILTVLILAKIQK